ncbi:MAG TPA: amidohydrolase family protein [Stellaceae bacterium]|jgi:imidazolonepropionase-like amidohydrolase|nr:amidohydrolase family protein [Stellaceae bacterium]
MKVLKNARLIDGTGAGPLEDATIVIRGDRIEAITTRNQSDWPAEAEIIDVAGMTVLPGLIDCHDHMANHKYDLAHRWGIDEPQSVRHLRTASVLKKTLDAGYTMIRDAGGLDVGFKRATEEGLIDGPRLIVSLAIISPIGGIGDRVSPSGHSPLLDCGCLPNDPLLPESVAETLADVRPVVRRMVRAGADVIKCATTGGASSRPGHGPRDGAFNLDEMEALVEEAHALDRRVMCHALGGRGLDIAIDAGVDSIEHGCYLNEDPRHLERMAERGIFFAPTLLVYEYHRRSPQPHVRERAAALYEHHIASIRRALDIGVRVVAGTDAGGHGHPANAGELECLVKAGMTPMQALQAATGWAAECLGRADELGTVEPGKRADLVAVQGDPLADISMLRDLARIALVIKDGRIAANRMAAAA